MAKAGSRHDFVIVIPVADRPQHLASCLASLLELRRRHPYAGQVSVLVADDSRDAQNIARHRASAADCTRRGLETHYLGQSEQLALLDALSPQLRSRLAGVIGDQAAQAFHHKGASITRNIAYLWLNRLQRDGQKRLFWFIDSDQEFRVNVDTPEGEQTPYAIDYFHWLDRIFSERPARILTGKVVGDPPVSSAVMAGNFLGDLLAFLADLARLSPAAACSLHAEAAQQVSDAAYHDMAELFGFKPGTGAYRYRCPLHGDHDHAACLADFAGKLARFFDGEHPTRRSFYQPSDPLASLQPARTIYTGNYVFDAGGLDYFIPFAGLKLRMAGPTLGRILQAELGADFVSANLPMLHTRTVATIGQSEFRPGIERTDQRIDLSGEFERQFFGDVMLFAMERLTAEGFPGIQPGEAALAALVDAIDAQLYAKYRAKHAQTTRKIEDLRRLASEPGHWWQHGQAFAEARDALQGFIDNMQHNFGADARSWQRIDAAGHRQARKAAICAAIGRYRDDRAAWCAALGTA